MRAYLSEDITIVDVIIQDGLAKEVEIILKEGTEIYVDTDTSIALSGDIHFDIELSEYNSIN